LGVFVVQSLTRVTKLSKPVISVGNLTMGGAGKTPLVELIMKHVLSKSRQPATLLRGYMPQGGQGRADRSDEVMMLSQKFPQTPILVGANRVMSAQNFLKNNNVDVFILDDGFQQWKLFRDLNILVIDATNPWGNGHLIPRGILREPLSAMKRAHMIVLTKTDVGQKNVAMIKQTIGRFNPKIPVVESIHAPSQFRNLLSDQTFDLSFIKDKEICYFCGIAAPSSLAYTLKNLNSQISGEFIFDDHHTYSSQDIQMIQDHCRAHAIDLIVTTEKDAVKLQPFITKWDKRLTLVSLKMAIAITQGKEVFFERIDSVLHR